MKIWITLFLVLAACGGSSAASDQHHRHHHSFADVETYAQKFDAADRDEWQKPQEVMRALDVREGMIVVDIGSGTGYFEAHLSPAVGQSGSVLACDIEHAMRQYLDARAQKEGWTNVKSCEASAGGIDVHEADRMVIINTWHHIEARIEYARRLATQLRAGGKILIVDFDPVEEGQEPFGPPAKMRLSVDAVISELEASGFDAVQVEETLPHQYFVLASRKSDEDAN